MNLIRYVPDLLNPLDALWGTALNGPMHRFTFSTEYGDTGVSVERLLRRYGMRIWGRNMDTDGELSFLVKRSQAVWAEYILCHAGIPLTCELLDQRNAQYAQQRIAESMPKPWNPRGIGAHSIVDHIVNWLAGIG